MNRKQKLYYAVAGFIIGNILLASITSGIYSIVSYQSSENKISYDEAVRHIRAKDVKELKMGASQADLLSIDGETKYSIEIPESQKSQIMSFAIENGLSVRSDEGSRNSFERLFQILFILFIISPPIIVVLLLIIIRKMNSNNSMK